MTQTGSFWDVVFAASPIVLLFVLVARGRWSTSRLGAAVLLVAVAVALTWFAAPLSTMVVALGKGSWLGVWILAVVWPALLLYRLAQAAGIERISGALLGLLPTRSESVLAVAWVLPSLIQGVAGFGTPIAVAAPLLVAMGLSRPRAVASVLVGYHWAVTFGSMGSAYYVAAFTSGLTSSEGRALAVTAAIMLSANLLAAGLLVLLLNGGIAAVREGLPTLLMAGGAMATMLTLTAFVVPAISSLMAGLGGVGAVLLRGRLGRSRQSPARTDGSGPEALMLLSPYLLLVVTAMPVLLIPASRRWVGQVGVLAPSFPPTSTGRGWVNPAVEAFTPLPLFGHPGTFVAASCVAAALIYRRSPRWSAAVLAEAVRAWARALPAASVSIVAFTSLAMVLVDSGAISTLASNIAATAGPAYPAFAPLVGALGSFVTGSSTSSNALFAALQSEIATATSVPGWILVAAQTVGANVGNAVTPVMVLIGLSAVDAPDAGHEVVREVAAPVIVLLALVASMTVLLAWATPAFRFWS